MSLEELKLLTDIKNSIISIDEHLQFRKDFNLYKENKTIRRAVERELEIIGEAISRLLKINPHIQISYARLIVDLCNKVIHGYDNVNDVIIWKVIIKDIPLLEVEVDTLLGNNK